MCLRFVVHKRLRQTKALGIGLVVVDAWTARRRGRKACAQGAGAQARGRAGARACCGEAPPLIVDVTPRENCI